jgi:hypothetical protein
MDSQQAHFPRHFSIPEPVSSHKARKTEVRGPQAKPLVRAYWLVSEGGLASYAGGGGPVIGRADRWIQRTTIACVALLAVIAGTVSYLHMHALVALHGQPGWVAALTPLSVDGMIVAASTALLADSRSGRRGVALPWALLVIGSVASLAANVTVAEPSLPGRVIAAWPSFALIGSYELLMRQVRRTAFDSGQPGEAPLLAVQRNASAAVIPSAPTRNGRAAAEDARRRAWEWAVANRAADGSLPSGKVIADRYGRHERWGRLVKSAGAAGEFASCRHRPQQGVIPTRQGVNEAPSVSARPRRLSRAWRRLAWTKDSPERGCRILGGRSWTWRRRRARRLDKEPTMSTVTASSFTSTGVCMGKLNSPDRFVPSGRSNRTTAGWRPVLGSC